MAVMQLRAGSKIGILEKICVYEKRQVINIQAKNNRMCGRFYIKWLICSFLRENAIFWENKKSKKKCEL